MKNVLITGGAGFIGSNFIRYLRETEPRVHIINLDGLTYGGHLENLHDLPHPDRHIFVEGNICDRDLVCQLLRQYEIDTVVHFAAETHVDRSISGPEQFIQTNVVGTYTLLEASRNYWFAEVAKGLGKVRFHHISTDEVFGTLECDDSPFSETTAIFSRKGEKLNNSDTDNYKLNCVIEFRLPALIHDYNFTPYLFRISLPIS